MVYEAWKDNTVQDIKELKCQVLKLCCEIESLKKFIKAIEPLPVESLEPAAEERIIQ